MAGIVVLAVAYVLSQFYRSFMAVLTPMLAADLGASNTDLSYASGFWFFAFAMMQFPVGVWLDRYGPRRTSAFLLGVCGGGGALLFMFAATPAMMILAMALIGMGCSPILMSAMFILAKNFRPSLFAVGASWVMAVGMAGNVIGASPMAAAAEFFGWRGVMGCLALLTLACAGLLFAVLKDPPRESSSQSSTGLAGYIDVARLRIIWPILPFVLMNSVISNGIRGLWAGPFLVDVHAADPLTIGNVTLIMALAMVAGSLVLGPLDNLFRTRKWVVTGGAALGIAAVAFLALYPHASMSNITLAFIFAGISAGSYGVLMAHVRTFIPANLIGRGVTAMNFLAIGGVGVMQVLSGQVLLAAEVPGDPAHGYGTMFAFYAIAVGAALFIYLFSREVRPERGKASVTTVPE